MFKKILIGLAVVFALPFTYKPFRQGFVEGFSEEWHKAYPDGFKNYIKNQ